MLNEAEFRSVKYFFLIYSMNSLNNALRTTELREDGSDLYRQIDL